MKKKHELHLSRLFCCNHTCYCIGMVSVTSASRYITSTSRYHPRYQSRSSMYIRCLIPRNFAESTEPVPIVTMPVHNMHTQDASGHRWILFCKILMKKDNKSRFKHFYLLPECAGPGTQDVWSAPVWFSLNNILFRNYIAWVNNTLLYMSTWQDLITSITAYSNHLLHTMSNEYRAD